MGDWDPDLHPRDPIGRFGHSNGPPRAGNILATTHVQLSGGQLSLSKRLDGGLDVETPHGSINLGRGDADQFLDIIDRATSLDRGQDWAVKHPEIGPDRKLKANLIALVSRSGRGYELRVAGDNPSYEELRGRPGLAFSGKDVKQVEKAGFRLRGASRVETGYGPVGLSITDDGKFALNVSGGPDGTIPVELDPLSLARISRAIDITIDGFDDEDANGASGITRVDADTNVGKVRVELVGPWRGDGPDDRLEIDAVDGSWGLVLRGDEQDQWAQAMSRAEDAGESLGIYTPAMKRKDSGVTKIEPEDDFDDDDLDESSVEAFDEMFHPRAPAETATGGQFVAGKQQSAAKSEKKSDSAGKALMGYDPSKGVGTGYDMKGGDARVKKLQAQLNALGLTDAKGRRLAVDGKLGPLTTQSIKAAQRRLGMPTGGKVTQAFLDKLGDAKAKRGAKQSSKESEIEDNDRLIGRVLEAKDDNDTGGRVFRTRIIAYGDSKNARRYPQQVLADASHLYEGSKAYDHHRTAEELKTSTINGIVGYFRDVAAETDGLYADLHLLPGAKHAAEALDATIAAQNAGLDPLIGVSHDVYATYKPLVTGGRRMQEATAITKVNSADLVADPAAGGMATRMVAGGDEEPLDGDENAPEVNEDPIEPGAEPAEEEEDGMPPTKESILGALAEATPEELAAVGLRKAEAVEDKPEPVVEAVTEKTVEAVVGELKGSFLGKMLIKAKVDEAGLPAQAVESVTNALPERITESDVDAQLATMKALLAPFERQILAPTITVTQESVDKKKNALDAFFSGNFSEGYHSFRQAFVDVTGKQPKAFDEDFNRTILRESMGNFDSRDRSTESLTASSWNLVLGDSITRRMVAEYNRPSLQTWRQVVSSIVPVNDFRTQRLDRVGGYGTLPTVAQGAPYQPLTSPGNEEVTYAISKKGGTEDITLEMIANDDVRAIANIPRKLGLAAAQTLYRFVWDFLNPASNPTIYDSSGLWTGHNNATTTALTSTAVSAGRLAMRSQSAYGDSADILSMTPRYLITVNDLEELAWQICTSTVAMPTGAPVGAASDIPNIHQGLTPLVVDYWTSTTGWLLVGDPQNSPTIEVGFYQGRQDPELFTQSDPSVGSMFNADSLTYKIRHTYSGAILDFRPFFRGQV